MCEASREHLQRVAAALPPEKQTPELHELLACYEDAAAAAALLRGVRERAPILTDPEELMRGGDSHLFKASRLCAQGAAALWPPPVA